MVSRDEGAHGLFMALITALEKGAVATEELMVKARLAVANMSFGKCIERIGVYNPVDW